MQGSEDEDMATKAFNALKEVSSARRRRLAPRGLPGTPVCLQGSLSLQTPSSPSGSLRLGWGSLGALRVTPPWSPQLVQECNASVQSMKRTEELIHLSKKIHFEGKVSAFSQGAGTPGGGGAALSPPPWGCRPVRRCPALHPLPSAPGLTPASSTLPDLPADLPGPLAGSARGAGGAGTPARSAPGQAEAVQQGGVPAPLQRLPAALPAEGVSLRRTGVLVGEAGALFFRTSGLTTSPPARLCCQGTLKLRGSPRKGRAGASPSSGESRAGLCPKNCEAALSLSQLEQRLNAQPPLSHSGNNEHLSAFSVPGMLCGLSPLILSVFLESSLSGYSRGHGAQEPGGGQVCLMLGPRLLTVALSCLPSAKQATM